MGPLEGCLLWPRRTSADHRRFNRRRKRTGSLWQILCPGGGIAQLETVAEEDFRADLEVEDEVGVLSRHFLKC